MRTGWKVTRIFVNNEADIYRVENERGNMLADCTSHSDAQYIAMCCNLAELVFEIKEVLK